MIFKAVEAVEICSHEFLKKKIFYIKIPDTDGDSDWRDEQNNENPDGTDDTSVTENNQGEQNNPNYKNNEDYLNDDSNVQPTTTTTEFDWNNQRDDDVTPHHYSAFYGIKQSFIDTRVFRFMNALL